MERMTAEAQLGRLRSPASWGLAQAITSWIAWFRREREARRAIDMLRALDDRMLADIGLDRSQAEYAARHGRLPHWADSSR